MRKVYLSIFMILTLSFLFGCSKDNESNIVKKLSKNLDDIKSYYLDADLVIQNNDDEYSYKVDVYYKEGDYYRVNLLNKENDHEQIILKDGQNVYVVTPSLKKSFKFQSSWPNDSSQIYLIASLYQDIFNSKDRVFEKRDDGYRFDVPANYPNNSNLVKQSIFFDKDLNLKSADVYNDSNTLQMSIKFNSIEIGKDIDDDIFNLDSIISKFDQEENNNISNETEDNDKSEEENDTSVASIDDIIYPLYIPTGTVLTDEEKVAKTDGERVILTFDGEKPFILVEETVNANKEFSIVPAYGDPYLLPNTIATISDKSINWISDGVEYYLVSDVMSQIELVEIANSVTKITENK